MKKISQETDRIFKEIIYFFDNNQINFIYFWSYQEIFDYLGPIQPFLKFEGAFNFAAVNDLPDKKISVLNYQDILKLNHEKKINRRELALHEADKIFGSINAVEVIFYPIKYQNSSSLIGVIALYLNSDNRLLEPNKAILDNSFYKITKIIEDKHNPSKELFVLFRAYWEKLLRNRIVKELIKGGGIIYYYFLDELRS